MQEQTLIRAVDEPLRSRSLSRSHEAADAAGRHPVVAAQASALVLALLLGAYVWLTETLQLVLRNKHFVVDLGVSALEVMAVYLAFAIVLGLVTGLLVRARKWHGLAVAVAYYVVLSLKMFWLDAPILMVPAVAITFGVVTLLGAGALALALHRALLPRTAPLLVVAAYFHVCQSIAANWATQGGSLSAFLLARDTLLSIALGAAGLTVCVIALALVETRRPARGRIVHAAFLALLTLAIVLNSARDVSVADPAPSGVASSSPDIYVLSFDALRRDALEQFVATNPTSSIAELVAHGTQFKNVVTEGASTYAILSNNTFAGAGRDSCRESIPGRLGSEGYTSAMLLGRYAKRIQGSHCYDYYYSGKGSTLVRRYALPGLAASLWRADARASLRAAFMSSAALVGELEHVVSASRHSPVFAYVHFLALHAPYVPSDARGDDEYIADIKQYMRECYIVACDPRRPQYARLIAVARRSYEKKLAEQDAIVRRVVELARQRGRDFMIVITADHGELFGEHGGFAHSGGFVRELLNVPFVVYDSRVKQPSARCELLRASDALRVTVARASFEPAAIYSDAQRIEIAAAPLGNAVIDRLAQTIRFEIAAPSWQHAGTWRNIHRAPAGLEPYPIETCQ